MDNRCKHIVSDRDVARAAVEADFEEEEEFHEEAEQQSPENLQTLIDVFAQYDIDTVLGRWDDEIAAVKQDDQERGLYEIEASLMADYRTRSRWGEGQISVCIVQFRHWWRLIHVWCMSLICLRVCFGEALEHHLTGKF
jgi:hypothetical protein